MSRTKAINEKCKDCIYDPKIAGTWREQVSACTSEKCCALWPYRPISIAGINANRKAKTDAADMDALIDSLEDDDDEVETPAAVA